MEMLPEPGMSPVGPQLTTGGNNAFHNFANDYSHISDPNLRRRLALSDIDRVPFGLYHLRAILVAGTGFFLDSYSIFAINLITTFLGIVFWTDPSSSSSSNGELPHTVNTALKASTSAGIVIGQVLFGWLADVFGRRKMYGIELGVVVVSTLGCALGSGSIGMSSTGVLVFWRVMMGVGIGGDYPLSSVITSEFAPTRWRGAMMAAVFSMQGMGQLISAIVALVVTAAFKDSFITAQGVSSCNQACQVAADRAWRIIVGFGALPACFALYYRITIPETPRYTFDVAQDIEKADADIKAYMASRPEGYVDPVKQARMLKTSSYKLTIPSASWPDVYSYFKQPRNLKILLGTTFSWFFLDLAFYGLGLNNTIILTAIDYSRGPTLYHTLYNNAVGMIILTCAGSLPGYWTAILTIDTLGRKPIQIVSFAILTLLFLVLGFASASLSSPSLLALYIIAQFFFNWGPNTTTFIIPGECFPTRYRSTGHGLSAAMGKVGAILAQVISIPLLSSKCHSVEGADECRHPWMDRLMQIFALFMLLGTATSLLVPETRGITLEELAGEEGDPHDTDNPNPGGGGQKKWWNPFFGGQPAGFFCKPTSGSGGGRAGAQRTWPGHTRSPRVGIMTSPELAAQQNGSAGTTVQTIGKMIGLGAGPNAGVEGGVASRGGKLRKKRRRKGEGSDDDDEEPISPGTAGMGMGVLPGWGAGWGRVEDGSGRGGGRGGGSGSTGRSMDGAVRLQDVGSLLK